MDKSLLNRTAELVFQSLVVAVAYLVLVLLNVTGQFQQWAVMAVVYGVVVLVWDLVDSAADTQDLVPYLVTLVASSVIVGNVATSTLVKGLVGEPYVALFATVLLVPGVVSWLLQLRHAPAAKSAQTLAGLKAA